MKKLLLLLFSLILSFNSYGGGADGKGLKCEHSSGSNLGNIYIWFDKGYYNIPYIEGEKISWKEGRKYKEIGKNGIYFDADKYDRMLTKPFNFLYYADLDRTSLRLKTTNTYIVNGRQNGSRYNCVLYSKTLILSDLYDEIYQSPPTLI